MGAESDIPMQTRRKETLHNGAPVLYVTIGTLIHKDLVRIETMKFQVEYAKFMKVEIEADSLEEAREKQNTIDDDYIEQHGENYEPYGYVVWNEAKQLN